MNLYLRKEIKKKMEELLLKYKHEKNIYEHGKQQNEWPT